MVNSIGLICFIVACPNALTDDMRDSGNHNLASVYAALSFSLRFWFSGSHTILGTTIRESV